MVKSRRARRWMRSAHGWRDGPSAGSSAVVLCCVRFVVALWTPWRQRAAEAGRRDVSYRTRLVPSRPDECGHRLPYKGASCPLWKVSAVARTRPSPPPAAPRSVPPWRTCSSSTRGTVKGSADTAVLRGRGEVRTYLARPHNNAQTCRAHARCDHRYRQLPVRQLGVASIAYD